jgi:hypothetical protein
MDLFSDFLSTDHSLMRRPYARLKSVYRYCRFYPVFRPLFDFFFINLRVRLQILSCVCPVVMSVCQGTVTQKGGLFISIRNHLRQFVGLQLCWLNQSFGAA